MPESLYAFAWPDGKPFKANWVTHWFEGLVKAAKIADCSIHDLRRSFSTLGQRAGVDRHIIKDLGGWSSVTVVEKHYSGDISPVYREAMDRIAKAVSA